MFPFRLHAAAVAAVLFPVFGVAGPLTLDEALQLATQHSEAARGARAGSPTAHREAETAKAHRG